MKKFDCAERHALYNRAMELFETSEAVCFGSQRLQKALILAIEEVYGKEVEGVPVGNYWNLEEFPELHRFAYGVDHRGTGKFQFHDGNNEFSRNVLREACYDTSRGGKFEPGQKVREIKEKNETFIVSDLRLKSFSRGQFHDLVGLVSMSSGKRTYISDFLLEVIE